ncbi:MAG: aspartate aminotransferase family protein [Candidatus Omnitrophota bacterium]
MNERYLLPVYKRVGPVFAKGRGSFLWDENGNRYLDFFPGWGVGILGHSHKKIVKAIQRQAKDLIFLPNNLYHMWQYLLAEEIVANSFPSKVFFANSGAEVVEAALKFSRLFGQGRRYEVISMNNSFHGRTFGAVSLTGQKKYNQPFRPLIAGCRKARFNDFDHFMTKVTKKTAGVILELIQGEGGVNVAGVQYIKRIRRFCDQHNILLIVDEVQTGMARTAKLFCYENYKIIPDIMLLSKGLGSGIPVSCMVVKKQFADIMQPGHHASTFGGNPLATRVAWEVFKVIKEEDIILNVREKSEYLFNRLNQFKAKFKIIKEVRGMGLMIGIELIGQGQKLFENALKRKLIINCTHGNVLRIMPALNIKREEIDTGLKILEEVFKEYE